MKILLKQINMKQSDLNKSRIKRADKIRLALIEVDRKRLTSELSRLSGLQRYCIIKIRNDLVSPRAKTLDLLEKALNKMGI